MFQLPPFEGGHDADVAHGENEFNAPALVVGVWFNLFSFSHFYTFTHDTPCKLVEGGSNLSSRDHAFMDASASANCSATPVEQTRLCSLSQKSPPPQTYTHTHTHTHTHTKGKSN